MKVYSYDPVTKKYLGESEAFPSPREPGVFLLPENATFIAPDLNAGGSYILVFENNSWSVLPKTIVNINTDNSIPNNHISGKPITIKPSVEYNSIKEIKEYLLSEAKKTFIYFCKEYTDNYYIASLAEGTIVSKEICDLRNSKKKTYEDYKLLIASANTTEELTNIGILTL